MARGDGEKSGGSALKRLRATLKDAGVIGKAVARGRSKGKAAARRDATARNAAGNRLYSVGTGTEGPASQKHAAYVQSAIERKAALTRVKEQHRAANPFEVQHATLKHAILNRRVKGTTGRPGAARKAGEQRRLGTISRELDTRGHVSSFVDRRFGENDQSMSVEDKMLERYMRERKAGNGRGGSLFNLGDDSTGSLYDEEGADDDTFGVLTHRGQSLMDAGDEVLRDDDDFGSENGDDGDPSKKGTISKEFVKYAHFGGFSDSNITPEGVSETTTDGRKKSKTEIMKEIIQKSKQHKRERQKAKDDDTVMMEEVDAELDDVLALLHKETSSKHAEEKKSHQALPSQTEEYDKFVRELASDRRVQATDRLKTDEELVKEAQDKLLRLEKDRVRRMKGLPTLAEEEQMRKDRTLHTPRDAQADDLGNDDYLLNAQYEQAQEEQMPLTYDQNGKLINKEIFVKQAHGEEESDEESNEDDVSGSEEEDDDSDESAESDDDNSDASEEVESMPRSEFKGFTASDVDDTDEDVDEEEEENIDSASSESGSDDDDDEQPSTKRVRFGTNDVKVFDSDSIAHVSPEEQEKASKELPYVFPCPETLGDLLELMDNRTPSEKSTIMERVRVLYDIRLGGTNKAKMQTLLRLIFKYFDYLCECYEEVGPDADHLKTIEVLTSHLTLCAKQLEEDIQEVFAERLSVIINSMLETVSEEVKEKDSHGFAVSTSHITNSKPPKRLPMKDLLVFELIPKFFSTSDLVHPVVSPAHVFMSHYIAGSGYHAVLENIPSALALCAYFHDYQMLSKRFMPEIYDYLLRILESCLPLESESNAGQRALLKIEDWSQEPTFYIKAKETVEQSNKASPISFPRISLTDSCKAISNSTKKRASSQEAMHGSVERTSVLMFVVELLRKLMRLWCFNQTASSIEMAKPLLVRLQAIPNEFLETIANGPSESISQLISQLEAYISTGKLRRRPLEWQKFKAIEMKTYVPKVDVNYNVDHKRRGPNKDKQAQKRLEHEYKKEFKGAVRELRKDAHFMARRKVADERKASAEYKKTMSKIMGRITSGN